MGRAVSSSGGLSSLNYLFGSGEAPKPAPNNAQAAPVPNEERAVSNEPASKPTAPTPLPKPIDITKAIHAGIHSTSTNNHMQHSLPQQQQLVQTIIKFEEARNKRMAAVVSLKILKKATFETARRRNQGSNSLDSA
ncbi:hypothetical protein ACFX2I_014554 [Malus domestica]